MWMGYISCNYPIEFALVPNYVGEGPEQMISMQFLAVSAKGP